MRLTTAGPFFIKNKSDTTERLLEFLLEMQEIGTPVRRIRCDNAGEKQMLRTTTTARRICIVYEFTAPGTPEQNGGAERKFAILYEYMRGMLNQASLPTALRTKLWGEAAHHTTDIINGICTPSNIVPPYRKFYGNDPKYFLHLKPFGEL